MRRRLTVVAVVALVVLAGCSGGGGSATPTEADSTPTDAPAMDDPTPTDTPDASEPTATPASDDTATPDESEPTATPTATESPTPTATPAADTATPASDDDQAPDQSALFEGLEDLDFGTEFEMHLRNSSGENIHFLSRNDTEANRSLIMLDRSSRPGAMTYYLTEEYNAVRNGTTGEIRYGQGDRGIELAAAFTAFYAVIPFSYAGMMDWEVSETRTIDGEEYYVYESTGFNETAASNSDAEIETDVLSAEGTMTVRSDGFFREMVLNISAENAEGETVAIDISLSASDEPVTVEQPDWFDESDAESETQSESET